MYVTRFIASTLFMLSATAAADPDLDARRMDRWSLTALAGTDLGLDLAAGLQVESPHRLQLTATVGWTPSGYAWGLSRYYKYVYDGSDAVADLLDDTISGAFLARANLGIRPLPDCGFVVSAGYTLIVSNKDGLLASAVERAGDGMEGETSRDMGRTFETSVRVHVVEAQVGWQWGIGGGFSLRASIGVLKIFHSSTSFTSNFAPADPAATALLVDTAERRLEDAGTKVWSPVVSAYLGYTF